MRKLVIAVLLALCLPQLADAQRWKRMRYEWVVGAGATNFLGELGGRDQIGSDFFFDFEYMTIRYAFNIGLRYKLSEYLSLKGGLSYAELAGDDKYTKEPFREYRNLHFKSPIVEWALQLEFSWMKENLGSRYKIRRVRGRGKKGNQAYVYGFVGVAGFYMNPMAKYNGEWVSLRPLNTEGQGFVPSRDPYSSVQFAIPFGVGMKVAVDKQSSVGIEFGLRKTFTDYIDDVSTSYLWSNWANPQDKAVIIQETGITDIGRALADPSLARSPSGEGCSYCPGQQRGDPTDLDSYMFLLITYNRKIKTTRKGLPKF